MIEHTCYDQERETAPDVLPPIPWKRVDVVKLNVKVDVRYAAQARKLSGAHTVPQVQLTACYMYTSLYAQSRVH